MSQIEESRPDDPAPNGSRGEALRTTDLRMIFARVGFGMFSIEPLLTQVPGIGFFDEKARGLGNSAQCTP